MLSDIPVYLPQSNLPGMTLTTQHAYISHQLIKFSLDIASGQSQEGNSLIVALSPQMFQTEKQDEPPHLLTPALISN